MSAGKTCISCDHNASFPELPLRERIASDQYWRVAHAFGVALLGWLVLIPRRHVTSIADLNSAEASSLGHWQVQLSQALGTALGCTKTYVAQFAEADGFSHVHFHVVPRMADLAEELRGPRIFTLIGQPDQASINDRDMDALAHTLHALLQR